MTKLSMIIRNAMSVALASVAITGVAQENEHKNWHLQDYGEVRGINVDKAYVELLADKTPQEKVIVAVVDSGIDIEHEDLAAVIWTNEDEIPGNGIDDDNNGYIDDVHGWNFIGGPNGEMVGKDNLEVSREYKRLAKKWEGIKTAPAAKRDLANWKYWQKVKNEFEEGKMKAQAMKERFDGFKTNWDAANNFFTDAIGEEFTKEDVIAFEPTDEAGTGMKEFLVQMYNNDVDAAYVADWEDYVVSQADWYYNPDVDVRRDIIKDNPKNLRERSYGNNNVYGPDASHGTHVAGIIAAVRDNGVGMNGVANNVVIMPVRTVPGGDEHDKDVANGIRYAVDNGARVINMSFGKAFSPNQKIVADALQYAEDKGVLLVHAAGNSSLDLDVSDNFPTNYSDHIRGKLNNFITVGASSKSMDEEFAASFSNYGDKKVDIFAPGVKIYASYPEDTYKAINGTSMASPVVAGVAGLIMSYYPDLSAKKVKKIIEKTGRDLENEKVYLPGSGEEEEEKKVVEFGELSKSNRLIDAYEALKLADKKSKY